jgi:hypothetical protein
MIFKDYVNAYTPEEIELNRCLLEACEADEVDYDRVEALLLQGADPLGPFQKDILDLSEHIYENIVSNEADEETSERLLRLTELFLKHGMDVSKPRVPYDDGDSIHPLWSFSFLWGEFAARTLKLLLDNGMDWNSASEFYDHSIGDQIYVDRADPNGECNEQIVWMMKMIMLAASYDHILDADEGLRGFLGCEFQNYDLHLFREWNDFYYKFDTSLCKDYPQFARSVIRIYESESGKCVWEIGVNLKRENGEFV